ncbi:MAG: glucose-6-phosphate dehydrogenase [Pseudohongiellaceae bacterium]
MAELIPVNAFDLIIFGGNGDLALRKLMPALWHRHCAGQFSDDSRILAVGRSQIVREDYIGQIEKFILDPDQPEESGQSKEAKESKESKKEQLDAGHWKSFIARLEYFSLDAMDGASWGKLVSALKGRESVIRAFYLALPPNLFGPIAKQIRDSGLMSDEMRLVLEKPVGNDFKSAREINDQVGEYFSENQIFRIDHYLGKETVQNLLALRFGNAIFEPLWRREVIDHVQITVAEELGVGNRIDFYDDIGALRDMVQNHLLQLLCLVAMEPPSSLDDDTVRDEKMKVLRALEPFGTDSIDTHTVRAQYREGAIGGRIAKAYQDELGGDSECETYVALKAEISNWRWSGVPFYLRTGKRLPAKHSEIVIQFKPVPHSIFPEAVYPAQPNRLSIMLQPDEGVKLTTMAKAPGPGKFTLRPVSLDLSFEETFGISYPDAYERLVIEVLRGNPALFMRRDEIEAAWSWIDGIIDGWKARNKKLELYAAGTWGPSSADLLLERDGRGWFPQ